MKDKKTVLILGVLVGLVLLFSGYLLWDSKRQAKEEQSQTNLPAGVEKYYQEVSPSPVSVSEVKSVSDIDNLSKEVDSTTIDVDSGLKQLDSEFAKF